MLNLEYEHAKEFSPSINEHVYNILKEKFQSISVGDHTCFVFKIDPVPKPRMVSSDKYKRREATSRYWAFKDQLRIKANLYGLTHLPGKIACILFYLPLPQSWSTKKKEKMRWMPHQQRPDLDNLLKGLQDALCSEDKHIYEITGPLGKYWGDVGEIYITVSLT